MQWSPEEIERYKRQVLMDGWGQAGQAKLKQSTVFVAGAGGLGSPAAIYLAVAGIGHLRICDFDAPDLSNLNRQILHDHTRVGVNKAVSAKETLGKINPAVQVTALEQKITVQSVDALVGESAIIVDCMDNFETRYVLNDCAIRKRIPLVHASVWGMEGRLAFLKVPETPCLRCLFPEGPPKETFPILGAVPGILGSLQALETVKYLTGIGKNLRGQFLVFDGFAMTFKTYRIAKDPCCSSC